MVSKATIPNFLWSFVDNKLIVNSWESYKCISTNTEISIIFK